MYSQKLFASTSVTPNLPPPAQKLGSAPTRELPAYDDHLRLTRSFSRHAYPGSAAVVVSSWRPLRCALCHVGWITRSFWQNFLLSKVPPSISHRPGHTGAASAFNLCPTQVLERDVCVYVSVHKWGDTANALSPPCRPSKRAEEPANPHRRRRLRRFPARCGGARADWCRGQRSRLAR